MLLRRDARKRVLIVCHDAGLESSRRLFESFGRRPEVSLRVLGPRRSYDALTGRMCRLRSSRGSYDLVTGWVGGAGHRSAGLYLTGLLRQVLVFRPHVIHVLNEAYAAVLFQALLCRRFLCPRTRCFGTASRTVVPPVRASRWEGRKRSFIHAGCDGVACWSSCAREALLLSGFPAAKLTVTGWGVSMHGFKPCRNESLRVSLGLSGSFVLGYLGRMEIEAGVWTLLHALRRLPDKARCLCVGGGAWLTGFQAKAAQLGLGERLVCVGEIPRDHVPAYLNAMDALVVPAETGSGPSPAFSRALSEAMACGLPVLSARCGALPEIVGDAGLTFGERDFVDLADGVGRLSKDDILCARLGCAARERAKVHLDVDALVSRLLGLYGVMPECP